MSDEAYDVALGVLRGFTMGEEVGSQALAVVESQNQALQDGVRKLRGLLQEWLDDFDAYPASPDLEDRTRAVLITTRRPAVQESPGD